MFRIKFTFLFFLTTLLSVLNAYSADRYWVGATNNNWNEVGNWSTTSGGAGGASVPGSADRALFNSNGNVNLTLDMAPTIESMDISVGYTATIDLNGNNLTINGATTNDFEDGTFNNTSGGAITLTCTGTTYFRGATFNPAVTATSSRLYLNGSRFNSTCTMTKNGANSDAGTGGNVFASGLTMNNSGSGYFMIGNGSPDSIVGNFTLNNTGSHNMYVAYNSSGTYVSGNVTINNNGASGNNYIYFADVAASSMLIGGNLTANNIGSGTNSNLYLGDDGALTVNGTTTATNNVSGTNGTIMFGSNTNGSAILVGNVTITNSSTGNSGSNVYLGNNGDITCSGTVTAVNSSTATTNQFFIANGTNCTATIAGATSVTNSGSGTTGRCWLGASGDITFNGTVSIDNSSTATNSQVYCNYNSTSSNTYNQNITITNSNAASDGIYFGSNTGASTLAANRTITIGGAGFVAGQLYFRNFTQSGATAQALATTGTTLLYNYDNDWGGDVTFSSPRLITRGTRYRGVTSLTKNGITDDQSAGGNQFDGNTTLNCSGGGYLMMGNGTSDAFTNNLTLSNSGSRGIYIAYNSAGNTVGGNITATNSGTGTSTWIYLSDATASTLTVTGNVDMTVSGTSTTCVARIGNTGDVTINGNLTWTRTSSSTTTDCYLAQAAASTVIIGGDLTYTQSGAGTNGRMWVGSQGDVTVGGNMTLTNSSTATSSQIYCNNSATSVGIYSGNIVVQSTVAGADGVFFGSSAGSGTLASTRTVTVGGSGFISGDLYFRNFTQTGATAQTLSNTGTGYIYNYDSDWGGDVTFTSGRINTRGTRYRGTAVITKNNLSDDQCVGGNQFDGNTTLNCSGAGYLMMGNGSSDAFGGNLILNNTGTRGIYLGYNSAGNTVAGDLTATNTGTGTSTWIYLSDLTASTLAITGNVDITLNGTSTTCAVRLGNTGDVTINGNVTWSRTSSSTTTDCYIANAAASTVSIGGDLTYSQIGAGTNGRIWVGNYGDVTVTGTMTLTNTSTATNSHIYCNYQIGSVGTYNGNIALTNTGAAADGIFFGSNGGSSTLAATRTVAATGGGITNGDIYFRNFTQVGATAQALTNSGTGYIYNYDSDWGGNVVFTSGRMYTRGTTYRGTSTLAKTGATDDNCVGGNTFTGDAILNNSGTGYLLMGNGTADVFSANLTMNNSGTRNMYLAYNSAGNSIVGNLVVNNSPSGTTNYIYISDLLASTLSIGGNAIINNTATSSSSNIYFGDDGDVSLTGDLTMTNSATGAASTISVGQVSTSLVTIGGNASMSTTASGTNNYMYFGNNGDVTLTGNLTFNNSSTATNGNTYIANAAASTVSIGGTASITNSGAGTTKRVYLGQYGDVTFASTLTIQNSSSATNSQVYCNDRSGSVNAYNGNIIIENTNAAGDGVLFGANQGSGTLAATRTITVGGGGFIAGDIYFRNFTQVGATAQALANTGTGYIYNYDSDWGGNVVFSSGRMYTRGTAYQGTATLTKNGASDDNCVGGNTFTGDAILNNSGSNYLLMGNGSPDVFSANLTMNNTGSHNMYLAYNSAGNSIAGNLVINNSPSGATNYIYVSDLSASTLSIGGNATINNTATSSSSNIYFGDDGDISLTGDLTFSNTATGATSNISVGQIATSLVTIGGNATITNSGTGTNSNMYFGNSGDVTLTGNLVFTHSASGTNGHAYLANAAASTVSIGGTATVSNSGAGTTKRVYFGQYGDVTVTSNLSISNSSSATNSQVYCNDRTGSVGTYNGNIVLESTNAACDGVLFGNYQGNGTLAATRTITVGAGGFISGDIYFRNFTQVGATAQSLNNTGIGYIYNYDCNWGGNVTFSSGRMYTRGSTYQGTATMTKTGASDDASAGGNSFTGDVVLTNNGSRYFGMGNGTADTYGANLTLNNSGTYNMYLGQNSAGNTVAGNLVVNNDGSGTTNTSYISNAVASTLTVTGTSTFTNSSTATTSYMYIGEQGDITFNNNVTLTNSGTGTNGYIQMANNTNSTVGITGNLTATNSASGTTKRIYLTNVGDLTVSGDLSATNSSSAATGEIYIGHSGNSTVSIGGNSIFSNSGAGTTKRIYIGNYGDVTFTGNLSILNSSSASNSQVYCNDRSGSVNAYNGNITIENTNASGDGVLFGVNQGSGTLAATRTITVGGGGFVAGQLYFRNFTQTGATAQALTLTGTAYMYHYTSAWGGNVTFAAPRYYTFTTNYSGTSDLEKTGATDDASPGGNTFTGAAIMRNSGSGYFLMGNGTADTWGSDLTMIATGTDHMYIGHNSAGNSIAGNLVSTNNGTGNVYMHISNGSASTLSIGGNATISNAGSGTNIYTYFGNSGDVALTGDLTMTNSASGTNGYNYIANGTTSLVTIGGNATVTNSGGSTTKRTYFGNNGDINLTGTYTLSNSATATNSQFYNAHTGNSVVSFGGNISVENTTASSDGVFFGNGGGTSTLASGSTISVGAGGFVANDLQLRNFTQLGNAASTITLTGTGRYYPYDATFGGNLTVNAERYYGYRTTYSGDFTLNITGATSSTSYGQNVFNGTATISHSGSGTLRLAYNVANDYNGNASFTQVTGALQPAYNQPSTFAGNITVNTSSTTTFGAGNGTVTLDGTGAQTFNDGGTTSGLRFRRMTLNKASGAFTLNEPLEIQTTATFTSGIMNTDATNLLTFRDEATVSGANDASHVDGPVDKVGNNAFEFPVGDAGRYRPISMSAPNSNSSQFRARYFEIDPSTLYGWTNWEAPIQRTSTSEYWTLDRIATTAAVSVTLSWNTNSGGVTDLASLTVCRHDGAVWRNEGNGSTTGNTTAGSIASSGSISSFSPFTLGSTDVSQNPLPVELVEFKATPVPEENVVDLFWVTSSEINNDYFTVERSKDLKEFEEVIQVPGQGTTNEKTEYREKDMAPVEGISYYRLSQTDYDGKVEYFDVEKVMFDLAQSVGIQVELYPNPNNGQTMFMKIPNSDSEELKVLVNDFIGKEFFVDFTVIDQGDYSVVAIEMNEKLAAGSYMVNIMVNDEVHTHKLIVQ